MNVLIFILLNFMYSQDRIDPQSALDLLTVPDSMLVNTSNKFKKAWNWSSESRKLDNALITNL